MSLSCFRIFGNKKTKQFSTICFISIVALITFLFIYPHSAFSSVDVTLAWDENTEEDLVGYRIYYRKDGQGYNYMAPDWEGTATTCTITINEPVQGGTYYFVARAFDTSGLESGDSNEVNFLYQAQANQPPVADAGSNQAVNEGAGVTLDGRGSADPDGSIASYNWEQTAGTAVALAGGTTSQPTFTAPGVEVAGGSLTFRLTVTDNLGMTGTDTVTITVGNINQLPIANAGSNQTVNEGAGVTLDGRGSVDPDGSIAGYNWEQTAGAGVALAGGTTTQPTFTAPGVGAAGGSLAFRLTVTDDLGGPGTDTVTVTVSNVNQLPIANAGNSQTVNEGVLVTLDGRGSADPDGSIASYNWEQTAGAGVALAGGTTAQPTFTAPGVGKAGDTLAFRLTVTDDLGGPGTDTVTVMVSNINQLPIADAGSSQTVNEGVLVTLDGRESADPDGSIVGYNWEQTAGAGVALAGGTTTQPTFTAPGVGEAGDSLTFRLTVTDDLGMESSDTCVVTLLNVQDERILIGLSIDGPDTVDENTVVSYKARALFSDGNTQDATASADWGVDLPEASIDANQALWAPDITEDTVITVTAAYACKGVTVTANRAVTVINIVEVNSPPAKPVITYPVDGQAGCELMPYITTDTFSDPDGDAHTKSQWQISEHEDFSTFVLDVTDDKHLTKCKVPHMVLNPGNTYYLRARFFDSQSEHSEWSDAIEFTTIITNNDLNSNGIPDGREVSNGVDLNNDGTLDNSQPDVIKAVESVTGTDAIGVCKACEFAIDIEEIDAIDPNTIDDAANRPDGLVGLFGYKMQVDPQGATVTVKVYFSQDISGVVAFYKYDTVTGWRDYSEYVTVNEKERSVTIGVQDGGHGDSDGVANGIIIDPGGIVITNDAAIDIPDGTDPDGEGGEEGDDVVIDDDNPSGNVSAGESGKGGGGGCFIGTAGFMSR